jgi:quercetin dioxygenase-like cupin family protein
MSRNIQSVTWLALTCAAFVCLSAVTRTDQAAPAQTPTGSQSTAREERMPRAGIDPNGVITGIATRLPNATVSTLRIRFEAGARTIWHTHVGPQLLLVEEGRARVQQQGSKFVDLKPGESIYLPPNVAHWHGAAPDSAVTMLSLYPIGSQLERGAEVTQSDYLGTSQTKRD